MSTLIKRDCDGGQRVCGGLTASEHVLRLRVVPSGWSIKSNHELILALPPIQLGWRKQGTNVHHVRGEGETQRIMHASHPVQAGMIELERPLHGCMTRDVNEVILHRVIAFYKYPYHVWYILIPIPISIIGIKLISYVSPFGFRIPNGPPSPIKG